ncbi:hypothetical protein E2320_007334 [Naja naja]|nr:hypothetical protein E2320_007334 [Naja naja]
MAGDYNMVVDNGIDKSNPSKVEIKYNNTDLRKFINRNKCLERTTRHKKFTRIDYIFVTPEILSKIIKVEMKIIKISDHAMVIMDMEIDCDYKQASRWKMDLRIFKKIKRF